MKKSIGSGRGSVYNIILKALQSGDKYGYEICKEVEDKTNGAYILKQPSLYSGLKRLEAQGDVKSYWRDSALGGRRHYYSLTESGLKRIEGSDFNWQDARDEIVDNLFEKSELDKTIESVENDIDSLKSTAAFNEQNQRDIDEILQNTDNLVNADVKTSLENTQKYEEKNEDIDDLFKLNSYYDQNEAENDIEVKKEESINDDSNKFHKTGDKTDQRDEESFENNDEYYDSSSNDLFSMFNKIEDSNKDDENDLIEKTETLNQSDFNNYIYANTNDEENINDKNFDKIVNLENAKDNTESNEENQYLIRESITNHSYKKNNEINDINDGHNNQGDQLDLFYFVNKVQENQSNKTEESIVDNLDHIVENKTTKNDLQDIENNLTTKTENYSIQSNLENKNSETQDINFDDSKKDLENIYSSTNKVIFMQKNDEDVLDEYKKQRTTFNTYIENSILENDETTFNDYYNNAFSFEKNEDDVHKSINQSNQQNLESENEYNLNDDDKDNSANDLFSFNKDNLDYDEELSESEKATDLISNSKKQHIIENRDQQNTKILHNSEQKDDEISSNNSSVKTENIENQVDYKDIFGDLISSQNKDAELDDELVYNSQESFSKNNSTESNFFDRKTQLADNDLKEEFSSQKSFEKAPELPRNNDAIKDINRTLFCDKSNVSNSKNDFESYDQTPFNETNSFNYSDPFERYDTYQKIEEPQKADVSSTAEQNSMYSKRTGHLAFDKKYANAYNKFEVPDYEVRYFKKQTENNPVSRYLSINKLNLVKNFIFSILIGIVTTIALIFAGLYSKTSGFQMFLFIISYLIGFGTLLFNFLRYSANKHKKVQRLNKAETMFTTFVAIVLVILSISVNLLIGFDFSNISGYIASFVLPIFYALLLILNYPLKKFLSKFRSFYN